jgi:hypothetical protein
MKFWSKEWFDALQKKANADREYLKKARRLTMKCQILATDAPGGVDKLSIWDVERGKIKSITCEDKPVPSDWRTTPVDLKKYALRAIASYEVFCGLHRGEFVPFTEVLKKGLTVQGDLAKLMSTMLAEFVLFIEFQSTIPAEY